MARPEGLEPSTPGLEGRCSIQLSYGRSQLLTDTPKYRLVGAEGFEPPTLCSQSRCATRLRYAPMPGRHIVASSLRTAEAWPGGGTIIRPPPGPVNLPVPFFCLKSGTQIIAFVLPRPLESCPDSIPDPRIRYLPRDYI